MVLGTCRHLCLNDRLCSFRKHENFGGSGDMQAAKVIDGE